MSLIQEPGSRYLGHVSPDNGSEKVVTASVTQFLSDNNIPTDKFVAVGCDGTNVNTERSGGVIRLLEEHYKKPLQWLVCQLHANELPLRHLLHHWMVRQLTQKQLRVQLERCCRHVIKCQ